MRLALVCLCLFVVSMALLPTPAAEPPTLWKGASWIWSDPSANQQAQPNEPIHVRRVFELKGKPAKAVVHVTADNQYELFVNGKKIGGDDNWQTVEKYDVAKQLVAGKNVVAIRARNGGGQAGLIAWLHVVTADKKDLVLGTDAAWKFALAAPKNWLTADFDDAEWAKSFVLGAPGIGPWNLVRSSTGQPSSTGPNTRVADKSINKYRPASEEINHFQLPEGFKIELVAAEPLVINPVCMTLDDEGRIYVSESHSYRYGPGRSPVKPSSNPIVRLDPLPDGKGYRRVLVAEGFADPVMGLAYRNGQLWATANNFLYRFDIDKNGKGINRQTLVVDKHKAWNPFGMFVLEWGPDGDLYLSVGNHNIDLEGQGSRASGRGSSGIVVRMKPDGSKLERLVHGLRVPYSFEFDPFGQLWLLSNGEGNPNRFVRVLDGVDYHCYSRSIVGNDWLAGRHPLAPPCFELPPGACTQLLRYYAAGFPASFTGNLFLDNWGQHGFGGGNRTIFRYVVDERNNVVAKHAWLTCKDPHFRCAHVHVDHEGNFLIADWYGRDDESDLTGRIWKVSYTGPDKPKVTHKLDSSEWKEDAYAMAGLDSPDQRIRAKAANILVERGDQVVAKLAAHAAGSKQALGAAGALWTLVRIGTAKAHAVIASGSKNADWRVRRLALELVRRYEIKGADRLAQELSKDEDPAVRVKAAQARGTSTDRASDLLAALEAGAAGDPHLRYEACWHLAENAGKDAALFKKLLASEKPDLRLAGLIALDVAAWEKFDSAATASQLLAGEIENTAADDHELIMLLARFHADATHVNALQKLLDNKKTPPRATAQALLLLRSLSRSGSAKLDPSVVQRFLDAVQSGAVPIRSADEKLLVLDILEGEGPTPFALQRLGAGLLDRDGRVKSAAHDLAWRWGPKANSIADLVWTRLLQPRTSRADRLAYLGTLTRIEADPNLDNWTKLLADGDPLVVSDAVRSWRAFAEKKQMVDALGARAGKLAAVSPALAGDLAAVLKQLKAEAVAKKLELPVLDVDKDRLAAAMLQAAAKLPEKERKERALLGRRVFERSACVTCHTAIDADTLRAPSLKGIGKAQKPDYLVESLLHPSKILKTGFETEVVTTVDGKIYSGLVKDDGKQLRIITADSEIKLDKSKVDERVVQKKSLMPENQEQMLSLQELHDLLAYLMSLR